MCGFPTNQQKSGASVWSARAAEPAAIVATLGGRKLPVFCFRATESRSTEKWRQRRTARGAEPQATVATLGGRSSAKMDQQKSGASVISCFFVPTRVVTQPIFRTKKGRKRTKCSSVATRASRFPRSGGRCRNSDSAFPCSKGRAIHIYTIRETPPLEAGAIGS